ncbi:MAG: Hsp20/alpha crystallin family protein [Verrucomicrobia bacterium]|nr:Hsp20/alpha crystallin family protein [Verrucomicrobiota bacterium]
MKLTRWQSPVAANWSGISRLTDLRDEIDRLFEVPLAGLTQTSPWMSGWTPALDVYEDKDHFTVQAEVPGMKKEDIEVSLHEGTLTISGERKEEAKSEEGGLYRSERYFGRFQRAVDLPASVVGDKVKAEYRDGILTITLPKAEEAKPKQINVNAG